jgi:U3 small nucleolar RNA-associated protein 20
VCLYFFIIGIDSIINKLRNSTFKRIKFLFFLFSNPGAPGSARAAILNFLAAAEPAELRPLIELFFGPLGSVFSPPQGFIEAQPTAAEAALFGPGQGTWWGRELGKQTGVFWLDAINAEALNAQPLRRRVGYLNTLEDILKHLGHRMEPFLPELLALAVVLLEDATTELVLNDLSNDGGVEEKEKEQGSREIRSRCLRLAATVMDRFPSSHDFSFLWPRLLSAAAPLMERIGVEAAADRPPPLVELCVALSASQNLIGILADGSVIENEKEGAGNAEEQGNSLRLVLSKETWAVEDHLGSRLLSRCIAALSCSTCAEPTRVAMLGALENIFDFVDPLPEIVLGQHTPLLLSGLQSVVIAVWKHSSGAGNRLSSGPKSKLLSVGQRGSSSGNKTAAPPKRVTATRALAILELVGGRASDWNTASQLTDAFLPLLSPQGGGRGGKRAADEELVARALGALTALWSRLGATANDTTSTKDQIKAQDYRLRQIVAAAAPLAGSLHTRDARGALGAMLSAVASLLVEELHLAATLFVDLSSFSTTEIDEADYETRMAAYTQLNSELWAGLSSLAAAPLVQLCARDLRSIDDLALRHAAAQALSNLIDAAAKELESETSECVLLLQKQLFPQLKRSIGASSLAVRQEHLALIRRLALSLPDKYPNLKPLTHKEAEADFWLNAAHLQLHRRARAFTRLGRMLRDPDSPSISIGVLVGLIGPLLQQTIVEGRPSEDDAGHEAKQVDVDRGANVVDAAVHALGAVASVLPWVQYQQLLGQYLRLMSKHSEGTASKAVLRAVCALLDAFHFLPVGGAEDEEEAAAAAAAAEDIEMHESEETEAEKIADKYALPPRAEVYRMLSKRVVPELRGQLVSGETVRAPVAQALVKVLKLLPPALMRSELPRTLQSVANLLKLRLQRLRDDARGVLVAMASDLGPEYLPFTLEVLRSALPDRGYTAHILGYTVHAVLEAVAFAAAQEPGSLDDCLPMILPVIEKDLFGHTAEAKEVDAFAASYKEAKRCRANDTYQLMASLVTFSTHVPKLLAPVRDRLAHASHPKTRAKLGMLLQYASQGLLANATTTSRDLCELVYAISDVGLAAEEAAREKALGASGVAIVSTAAGKKEKNSLTRGRVKTNISEAGDEARIALHQPLLVEFALTTFKAALKKGLVPTQGPEATALLDPLLPLLIRALQSRHSPSVTASLQALSLLIVHAELPGLDAASADAGKAVTDLLKRCPKTTDPVAQDCFKLLAGMLRRCERYAPSQAQLRFLLGWAFTDLEESAQRQTAFTLLRAILARKLVLPEVYDLMERVQELMVRSQSKQVRQLASNSLLAFLLDYPLGQPRLQAHIQFLLANLGYEHESGREAALSMLSAVIMKFPEEVVAGWAEIIFLPLVTRLVNDPSAQCRAAAAACAGQLLSRIPVPRRDHVAAYCTQWLRGNDPRLVRASAQALGILVEVEGAAVAKRVVEIVPAVSAVLRDRADADQDAQKTEEEEEEEEEDGRNNNGDVALDSSSAAPGWQEAYYCLSLLEKMMTVTPGNLGLARRSSATALCWSATCDLLLHRHAWVRKAAGRLVGAGLAAPNVGPYLLSNTKTLKSPDVDGDVTTSSLSICTTPGSLAMRFFRQLESATADEGMAGQAVKCMVFLSIPMLEEDEEAGRVPAWRAATSTTLKKNQVADSVAAEAAQGEEDNGQNDNHEQGEEDEIEQQEEDENAADTDAATEAAEGSLTVNGLIRRMVRLADDKSYVRQLQRGAALRFIAAISSRLGAVKIEPFLPVLLRPLYRITEPGALGNTEEFKVLGDEVMAHLRSLVGADVLLAAYGTARETVRRQRGERKKRAAVQTLVDPEAAAKRKIRAAERKKGGKKKAMEEVRRMRSAGIVVKNKKGVPSGGGKFGKGGGNSGRGGRKDY